jgi:hypothetical protein
MICLVSISHYSISTQCVTSCTGRLSSFGVAWCHVGRVVQDAIAAVEEGTADAAQERIVEARLAGAEAGSKHGPIESVVRELLLLSHMLAFLNTTYLAALWQ